jgi:hypothetical protein
MTKAIAVTIAPTVVELVGRTFVNKIFPMLFTGAEYLAVFSIFGLVSASWSLGKMIYKIYKLHVAKRDAQRV